MGGVDRGAPATFLVPKRGWVAWGGGGVDWEGAHPWDGQSGRSLGSLDPEKPRASGLLPGLTLALDSPAPQACRHLRSSRAPRFPRCRLQKCLLSEWRRDALPAPVPAPRGSQGNREAGHTRSLPSFTATRPFQGSGAWCSALGMDLVGGDQDTGLSRRRKLLVKGHTG